MTLLIWLEVILVFSFMIFVHEGGHYLACRLFKIDVDEFALGFGTILFSRKWGKTLYTIRAVPLGGFCKPKGGDLSGESAEKMYAKPAEPGDFLAASWWKRIVVFVAGPGMNFLSAFVLIAILFLAKGEVTSNEDPVLGFVPPGSLAEMAGLKGGDRILKVNGKETKYMMDVFEGMPDYGQSAIVTYQRNKKTYEATIQRPAKPQNPNRFLRFLTTIGVGPSALPEIEWGIGALVPPIVGQAVMGNPARNAGIRDGDTILSVNGQKVADWAQMAYLIHNIKTDPLQVEILRENTKHTLQIKRIFNGTNKAIGIVWVDSKQTTVKRVSLFQAIADSAKTTYFMCVTIKDGIRKLVWGEISLKDNIAGPVTIVRWMYSQASQGWEDLIHVVATISLVLFLMNLLPIPIVDGGQIVLCVLEGIARRHMPVKFQMVYQQVGFLLIVALMGIAIFNDFFNLFLEKFHSQIH